MVVGLMFDPRCEAHDPGAAHPERPARLEVVRRRLEEWGSGGALEWVAPPFAREADLARVHTEAHVESVRRACRAAPTALDPDTVVSTGSWEAALLAAGAPLAAARRVVAGDWSRAFCAVRPPGHHAERARAMGFCLFNSIAVAARGLLADGLERIAVLDWDVHHGNGTQDVFYDDPRVLYASLHQWPLYPGTGTADERGVGDGEGSTLNVPLAAGSGDLEWRAALEQRVLPALEAFAPEMLLVSAGFDAHALDPLAGCRVSTDGYAAMTRAVLDVAGGRVVSVLEGGYHLAALADSVEVHVAALCEGTA